MNEFFKNSIESFKKRLCHSEERMCELQDRSLKIIQLEEKKEIKMIKNEGSLHELCDTIKYNSIHIMGVSEREDREKGAESLFLKK